MRIRLIVSLALLLHATALAFFGSPAQAADRVALVIGNGAYQKVPALPNPPRDADDIAASLGRLGFSVSRITNANGGDMRKALIAFGRAAAASDMAVVFYAGHGIEVGGENWLIPVDAELQSETDTESEAISLKAVTQQVAKSRQLGLVILDACRSNPFDAKMQRLSRKRVVTRGYARVEPVGNVLVAYAAKDGTTADDGDGRNSPFTAALLRNIEIPGLEINFLFRTVRDDVMSATKRQQEPYIYGSLSKAAIYLKPANAPSPAAAAPISTPADEVLWDLVKGSEVAASFEEFLKRYPASARAKDARARLDSLKSRQQAALPPPQAPAPPVIPPAVTPQARPAPATAPATAVPSLGVPQVTTPLPSVLPPTAALTPIAPGAVAPGPRTVSDLRGQRREVQEGGRTIISEPGRVIIREPGRDDYVRNNELDRFRVGARDIKTQTTGGETRIVVIRPDRTQTIAVFGSDGLLLRRFRRDERGREIIIVDNSRDFAVGGFDVGLAPPVVRIPYSRYIVDYESASPELIYDTMLAPPIDRIQRRYSLDEIRYSSNVRKLMPSIDVDSINFETGSWEIPRDQAAKLQVIADGLNRAIAANPRTVFLIEGHANAVADDVDALSLSDRRAESVATLLTQQFGVRPDNLASQGYGPQYLKQRSDGPSRINRVTIRNITPLLKSETASPPPGTASLPAR